MVLKMCKENSHVCYTLLISRKGEYLYAKRNKSKAKIIPSRTDHGIISARGDCPGMMRIII